jgi:hypothetical protein
MKPIFFIPLLVLASCVSRRTPEISVNPLPPTNVDQTESVRFAETLRLYHIGRYVDPNHPDVMHEKHPVYRVEAYSQWNLKPSGFHPGSAYPFGVFKDAAFFPPPMNDVVLAEVNRQRNATERVMQEAARLAMSYDQLQNALNEMRSIVTNHLSITSRLSTAEQRVSSIENHIQTLARSSVPATNEVALPVGVNETPPK